METPLISVLIPLYNHSRYIERCLDSVLEDGYPAIEMVVIDDGSTDDSYSRCLRWRDRYASGIRSFRLARQQNAGITKTRNALVQASTGEFVVFLASDDYLLPGGIAARLAFLRDRPEALAVFGDAIIVDENGRQIAKSGLTDQFGANKQALRRPEFIVDELILRWSLPGSTDLLRRIAFDPGLGISGYDETLFIEDRDFYLRLLSLGAVGFLDRPVSAYRIHSGNTSRRRDLALRIARSNLQVETQNISRFSGLSRWLLQLSRMRAQNYANWRDRKTPLRFLLGGLFRSVFMVLWSLHGLRAAFTRSTSSAFESRRTPKESP